jgi:hypothetical protein
MSEDIQEREHALLSPSGAHRWMRCPGSVRLEQELNLERTSSEYSSEGTAAHKLAAMALEAGNNTDAYHGLVIEADGRTFEVDQEMQQEVQKYVDVVRDFAKLGDLMIEQRLPIEHMTGEKGACGTADAVVLAGEELIVIDLKYGKGIKVDAEKNEQLLMYASAALRQFSLLGDGFNRVRVVISQPRRDHLSEWDLSVEELAEFEAGVLGASFNTRCAPGDVKQYLNPGPKQCKFCPAKAHCEALKEYAMKTVVDDFVDVTQPLVPQLTGVVEMVASSTSERLGQALEAVDLIEDWCSAVRKKAAAELHAGREVPKFKLVEGKKGARTWADAKVAEEELKRMRLKECEMYDFKLISPTSAEKLHKSGVIGPRQWPKLQSLVIQPKGSPSVVPVSDRRPALVVTAVADEFQDLTGMEGLL